MALDRLLMFWFEPETLIAAWSISTNTTFPVPLQSLPKPSVSKKSLPEARYQLAAYEVMELSTEPTWLWVHYNTVLSVSMNNWSSSLGTILTTPDILRSQGEMYKIFHMFIRYYRHVMNSARVECKMMMPEENITHSRWVVGTSW